MLYEEILGKIPRFAHFSSAATRCPFHLVPVPTPHCKSLSSSSAFEIHGPAYPSFASKVANTQLLSRPQGKVP
jgi:hypothetical protein